MEGRVNAQYIIEGLSAGFMIVLGGLSLLALDAAADKTKGRSARLGFLGAGTVSMLGDPLFVRTMYLWKGQPHSSFAGAEPQASYQGLFLRHDALA